MIGRKRERRLSEFGRRGCWRRGSSRVGQATISIVGSDRRGGSTDPIHPSDVGGTFDQPTSPTSNDRTPLPMNPCPQRTLQRPVQDHLSSVLEPPPKDEGRLRSPRARRGPKSPSLSSSRSATPPLSRPDKRGFRSPRDGGLPPGLPNRLSRVVPGPSTDTSTFMSVARSLFHTAQAPPNRPTAPFELLVRP